MEQGPIDKLELASEASKEEGDEPLEKFIQKATTLPTDLVITLVGFADEQDAQQFGSVVRSCLEVFGRLTDLSRLDRVYLTFQYAATLASIDLRVSSGTILKPTDDEIATGIAMGPA